MKKRFAIIALSLCATATAFADKPVSRNELPQQARNFLTANFPKTGIEYATVDRNLFDADYDVVLDNGTHLEFSKRGEWTEITSSHGNFIPSSVLPAKMAAYISKNYPKAHISQIERERGNYEVALSNGVEITFNKESQVIYTNDLLKHQPNHRFSLL